jgi:hypothetical protein
MHLINRFKGEDPRNTLPKQGAPGLYEVTFVLRRPGFSLNPEGQISFAAGTEGDSHLAISKPAFAPPGNPDADRVMISGNTADGRFTFLGFPNKKGFLGKLVTTPFQANTRQHAEEIAYRAICSSLSDISLNLDIPLDIASRETKELVTGNVQLSLRSPYSIAPLAINPTSLLITDYRYYASLYREAMITNSPVFEYLCLFKIVEALQWRRRRLQNAATKNGTAYTAPREVLPSSDGEVNVWLRTIFPAWRELDLSTLQSSVPADVQGRPFEEVINRTLRPLRDSSAHALFTDTGELTISSDDLLRTIASCQMHREADDQE